ncbi:MAG: HAD hydrolase-like protein [Bacillota bacterium]|nr:HAD hydrolase-like protein [Bacillota bacterium]
MKYKYILFDLDGTLTDSGEGIINCVKYTLEHFNIPIPDYETLKTFVGPPLEKQFQIMYGFSEEKSLEAMRLYRERFSVKGIFENSVYEGIPQTLDLLSKQGYTLAVATSKPEIFTIRILDHFNLSNYFSALAGSEMDGRRTDKQEVIEETLSRLGNPDKSQVIMVGDRIYDVAAAKSIGIDVIGVTYGYASEGELEKACPSYFAKNPEDIAKIVSE